MKKIVLLIAIIVLTSSICIALQIGAFDHREKPAEGGSLMLLPPCIPGMISWWPGEEDAQDIIGGNNGTLQHGATFAQGEVGRAFSFDGLNDDVLIGDPASLNPTSMTIEAWVNTNSFPDGTITNVVAKWGGDGAVDSYLLGLINNGGVIQVFGAIGDGVTGDPGFMGGSVSTNTWTHIAMIYNSANGTNRLYLNGAGVASRTRTGGIYQTATNVYIGREDSVGGRFFNGLIDETSIYSRVLSGSEIGAIYNAGSAGKCSAFPSPTATQTFTPSATNTATYTPTPSATSTPSGLAVSVFNVSGTPGLVVVPVTVGDTTGYQIISYDLQITYDPAVIQPATPVFDSTGTVSSGMAVIPNTSYPGHLPLSGFQATPLTGSGTLIYLRFNVVGTPGQSTTLVFEDYTDPQPAFHTGFTFNEGSPQPITSNGSVTIPNTQPGSNVMVGSPSGDASISFGSVGSAGTTTFTPIDPGLGGEPPSGFAFCSYCPAYDITTSASYTPPLTVCLFVPPSVGAATFAAMRLLHSENGTFVDITTSHITNPDSTREVCGSVNSLSPFALVEPASVSGTVLYGNAAVPPKFISNATVTGTGSPSVFTTTSAPGPNAGDYSLTGFGDGSYTVSLSKTTGQNSINSFDAARIAQHVAGTVLLTSDNQRVSADVTGNNAISSNDAAKIAQVVAGLPLSPPNLTGQWRFYLPPGPTFPVGASPTNRTYPSVPTSLTGEDYIGLLIGEVTGNWTNTGARPTSGPVENTSVDLPRLVTPANSEVVIPVSIQGAANKGIISYEFALRYDPSVMQPQAKPVDLSGTASRGFSAVANPNEPGLLRVVVYGAIPIDSDGVLLNLRFTAVGAPGSVSLLTWERIMFNEGDPGALATDGKVELSTAAENQAE